MSFREISQREVGRPTCLHNAQTVGRLERQHPRDLERNRALSQLPCLLLTTIGVHQKDITQRTIPIIDARVGDDGVGLRVVLHERRMRRDRSFDLR